MLVKCGVVRMTGKSGDPIVGDGQEDPSHDVFSHLSPLTE